MTVLNRLRRRRIRQLQEAIPRLGKAYSDARFVADGISPELWPIEHSDAKRREERARRKFNAAQERLLRLGGN